MTTPSVDRPVSVEPMTPIRALATIRRWADHMRAENAILQTRSGAIISADVIDAVLSVVADAHARAFPLPRRYTGGPLEDGVYLFQRPTWDPVNWTSFGVAETVANPYAAPKLLAGEWVWLIGPIHIPPIPESEEAK